MGMSEWRDSHWFRRREPWPNGNSEMILLCFLRKGSIRGRKLFCEQKRTHSEPHTNGSLSRMGEKQLRGKVERVSFSFDSFCVPFFLVSSVSGEKWRVSLVLSCFPPNSRPVLLTPFHLLPFPSILHAGKCQTSVHGKFPFPNPSLVRSSFIPFGCRQKGIL